MNPNAWQLAALRDRHDRERAAQMAHRDGLHRKAIERRRKAKRGGKR